MTGPLSEGEVQPQQPTGEQGQGQTSDAQSGMYDQYLAGIPAQFHQQVTKAFKEWDGNVTRKMQDIQARYTPYQQLIDSYQPDRLAGGVSLLDYLENDPQGTIAQLAEFYGIQPAQGEPAGDQQQELDYDDGQFRLPQEYQQKLEQIEQITSLLAQQAIDAREQQQLEAEAQRFDSYLGELMTQEGLDPNDRNATDFILAMVSAREVHPSDAITAYKQVVDQLTGKANGASAPMVMPAGGGLPSNQLDPRTLDRKATRELVANLIAQSQGT